MGDCKSRSLMYTIYEATILYIRNLLSKERVGISARPLGPRGPSPNLLTAPAPSPALLTVPDLDATPMVRTCVLDYAAGRVSADPRIR
jgi:hypothetical protein